MARTTYIQDPVTNKLIPKDEYYASVDVDAPMVLSDIQPYKSMVTGEMITSRSQHRDHLKRHGLVEVGNETKYLKNAPPPRDNRLREQLARNVYEKLRYK